MTQSTSVSWMLSVADTCMRDCGVFSNNVACLHQQTAMDIKIFEFAPDMATNFGKLCTCTQ